MDSVVGPWPLLLSPQYDNYGASASVSPVGGPVLVGTKRQHGPPAHLPCADRYRSARPLARPRLSDVTSQCDAAAGTESEHLLFSSWQHSQKLASPAAPAPGSASSTVPILPAGAWQSGRPVCGTDLARYGAVFRQQHAGPGAQPAAKLVGVSDGLSVQLQPTYVAPSSSTATTATASAGCPCCHEATQQALTAPVCIPAYFQYHFLPQEQPAQPLPLQQCREPEYERCYDKPSARASNLLPPLTLDRRQQPQHVQCVYQPMPAQQQPEQLVQMQVSAAAAYCHSAANEAAVPSLNRTSYSSSYASTLYTTTSCAATSCDDDVTQCQPQFSSHHALAQMQLRMQDLIQTLAPVVSTWQALGPGSVPEPQPCGCVQHSTYSQLDDFASAVAPPQEVERQWRFQRTQPPQQQHQHQQHQPGEPYDLPWLMTPLPPAPVRAPGQPSRFQQAHPQQRHQVARMQPQQDDASSAFQWQAQPVPQLPVPPPYQQPAALTSHTLRHLLLQQQPHWQQQHQLLQPQQLQRPSHGIVVLAAVSPPSRWQHQPALQQERPPSQCAQQPHEGLQYQQASSGPDMSRLPRFGPSMPATNSTYEWIMHVCTALVLTPDSTGRLAAHIFHRVEDAVRLMVAARPYAGPGRRDDGAGGASGMAAAERVYGMAAIWIAAKLEERRREMPRASSLAAVVRTTPGVLAAVELRILQWVDWAPLEGFVPDDSHLLTWGPC
ncbi:hypothetical protein CHLRE_06g288950v5 [Chlamydomonas reinhardtii]|uniref:Uncharacterized protein n=1 Tax=Chlamydomonas reinhardtii TaxID=3055 RepID=A0A2K3DQ62_CHLRE|nr:uncharacterized protein CHLRE_06g288950v5 [Chlamydomonas reinhardtii]PNW82673.1 hypothetical protein CHLRE_06g288950v5 [Chlamydomonas reinhardtii]